MREFAITQVRVTAAVLRGDDAVIEGLAELHCAEGRRYVVQFADDVELHSFEYAFIFRQKVDDGPLTAGAVEARIVIEGRYGTGHPLEIRGDGWIGYDNEGSLEGRFDDPPVILTDACNCAIETRAEFDDTSAPEPRSSVTDPKQSVRAPIRLSPQNDE